MRWPTHSRQVPRPLSMQLKRWQQPQRFLFDMASCACSLGGCLSTWAVHIDPKRFFLRQPFHSQTVQLIRPPKSSSSGWHSDFSHASKPSVHQSWLSLTSCQSTLQFLVASQARGQSETTFLWLVQQTAQHLLCSWLLPRLLQWGKTEGFWKEHCSRTRKQRLRHLKWGFLGHLHQQVGTEFKKAAQINSKVSDRSRRGCPSCSNHYPRL